MPTPVGRRSTAALRSSINEKEQLEEKQKANAALAASGFVKAAASMGKISPSINKIQC